jgi:hypothetical protein
MLNDKDRRFMIKRSNLTTEIEMLKRLEFDSSQELDGLKNSWENVWKAQKWSKLGTC